MPHGTRQDRRAQASNEARGAIRIAGTGHARRGRWFNPGPESVGGVLFRNLRQYDRTVAMRDDIFRSDLFQRWEAGDGELTLALPVDDQRR
jgi:hypothetical protein